MLADNETSNNDNECEALKPGMRSLIEAIERTTKPTDVTIRNKVTRKRIHADFFTTYHEEKHSSHQVVR
jgi:protoporphyrinogen oxidase